MADLVWHLVVSGTGHHELGLGGVLPLASAEAELGPGLFLDSPVILVLAWAGYTG